MNMSWNMNGNAHDTRNILVSVSEDGLDVGAWWLGRTFHGDGLGERVVNVGTLLLSLDVRPSDALGELAHRWDLFPLRWLPRLVSEIRPGPGAVPDAVAWLEKARKAALSVELNEVECLPTKVPF